MTTHHLPSSPSTTTPNPTTNVLVDGHYVVPVTLSRLTRSMLLDRVEQLRSVGRYHAAEAALELAIDLSLDLL